MHYSRLLLAVLVLALAGCGALQLSPVTSESRVVQPASDASKILSVPEGMVWYDASPATHGLRFPAGRYMLEAENSDYWYFRSPVPLEFHVLQNGKIVDSRDIPGGLMLAKHFSMIPGGGYIDGEGQAKMMVWKLGKEFLHLEGKYWTRNF
jgi:hypothetical protein